MIAPAFWRECKKARFHHDFCIGRNFLCKAGGCLDYLRHMDRLQKNSRLWNHYFGVSPFLVSAMHQIQWIKCTSGSVLFLKISPGEFFSIHFQHEYSWVVPLPKVTFRMLLPSLLTPQVTSWGAEDAPFQWEKVGRLCTANKECCQWNLKTCTPIEIHSQTW